MEKKKTAIEARLQTGLVHVLTHVRPIQPKGLGVGVAAGQELEGHPAEADLLLQKKSLTPRGQFIELGEDEAGLPVGTKGRNISSKGNGVQPQTMSGSGAQPKPLGAKAAGLKWQRMIMLMDEDRMLGMSPNITHGDLAPDRMSSTKLKREDALRIRNSPLAGQNIKSPDLLERDVHLSR
ncbi:hypothetical protein EYF80_012429 [Liparis tanakae]|uniref:Uncharacterized protein n=1 Tax=Liparis tanakae TaxID=230148 RepID=A0A4Z2II04_9TELE|nr:hypothetical protein EYF80_012429 [Liparis tanakae]